jgi:hypothetical protein
MGSTNCCSQPNFKQENRFSELKVNTRPTFREVPMTPILKDRNTNFLTVETKNKSSEMQHGSALLDMSPYGKKDQFKILSSTRVVKRGKKVRK